ncbi:MAG: bifunctional 3,4-dihydroxy-2-butanone-4-phosphate synthase/GTP cyclohydrolase II [Candidatus Eisenbacteria bacterium]|nr:bifunctional 3,4-dihydroxy-2-butanone-4-phosphate synthase/GTP cyclohydrolase II [Candidatus Eisenbacteria bacterium]
MTKVRETQRKAARTVTTRVPSRQRGLSSVEEAVADIRRGRMIVVVDDAERENEGDLVMAAEKVTPEAVNFMTLHARGLMCAPMDREWLDRLELKPMSTDNTALGGTAYTVSVDAKLKGVTTGISAHDRAATLRHLASRRARPGDFARPGHIFPIRAEEGGVLRRAGHTEAAVDLARLAGLNPVGVVCEIMAPDGSMARARELRVLARRHRLKLISVEQLIAWRRRKERLVECVVRTRIPTPFGEFGLCLYESRLESDHHVALVRGDVRGKEPVLVRVHSQCLTGDVLHSLRCDCGEQRDEAMKRIARAGRGVFLYMRQEGRGIGLANKLRAYALQDQGYDTVEANLKLGFPADLRDYGIGAQILSDLGVRNIRLMTNNPRKVVGLAAYGLKVVDRVSIQMKSHPTNRKYLATKREKLGHLLTPEGGMEPAAPAKSRGARSAGAKSRRAKVPATKGRAKPVATKGHAKAVPSRPRGRA